MVSLAPRNAAATPTTSPHPYFESESYMPDPWLSDGSSAWDYGRQHSFEDKSDKRVEIRLPHYVFKEIWRIAYADDSPYNDVTSALISWAVDGINFRYEASKAGGKKTSAFLRKIKAREVHEDRLDDEETLKLLNKTLEQANQEGDQDILMEALFELNSFIADTKFSSLRSLAIERRNNFQKKLDNDE